jgi:hypothetical protein
MDMDRLLVGRDAECVSLRAGLAASQAGSGSVILIAGEGERGDARPGQPSAVTSARPGLKQGRLRDSTSAVFGAWSRLHAVAARYPDVGLAGDRALVGHGECGEFVELPLPPVAGEPAGVSRLPVRIPQSVDGAAVL